jgi:O-antigen/teichoic acid export membrane protein
MSENKFMDNAYRDMFKYIPFKIVPAISAIIAILILTSHLSINDYGVYSSLIVTLTLLSQLTGAWLYSSVLYVFPSINHDQGVVFRNKISALQLVVLLPSIAITFIVIYLISRNVMLSTLAVIILFFQVFNSLLYSFLQSAGIVGIQSRSVSIQSIIQIGLLVAVGYFSGMRISFAVLILASSFFAGYIYVAAATGFSQLDAIRSVNGDLFDFKGLKQVLTFGIPMSIWFFSMQFFTFGDRILLNFFKIENDLGLYSSYRDLLTGGFSLLTMPLLLASHPIIMKVRNNKSGNTEIEELVSANIMIVIAIFLPAILFVREFYLVIFTDLLKFNPIGIETVTQILLSIMTGAIAIYAQKGLEVAGKTIIMAKIAVTVVLLSVTANLLIIPRFGISGLAAVNFASQLLYLIIVYLFAGRYLKLRIRVKSLLIIIVFCAAIVIIMPFFTGFNHYVSMIIFVAIILTMYGILPETGNLVKTIFAGRIK